MDIDYRDLLTDEQKRSILDQRLVELAAMAYQHEMNLASALKVGDEQTVEVSNRSLDSLKAAIKVHKDERDSLPAPAAE